MKQFSLEEYVENPLRRVITRNGNPVRIICTDGKADYPIIALIDDDDEFSVKPLCCDVNGNEIDDSDFDLFFAPENIDGWVNIYKQSEDYIRTGAVVFKTKEEAMNHINGKYYITTVHIEWEEE